MFTFDPIGNPVISKVKYTGKNDTESQIEKPSLCIDSALGKKFSYRAKPEWSVHRSQ